MIICWVDSQLFRDEWVRQSNGRYIAEGATECLEIEIGFKDSLKPFTKRFGPYSVIQISVLLIIINKCNQNRDLNNIDRAKDVYYQIKVNKRFCFLADLQS